MAGVKISNIVKRSISLDPKVNDWAEELARGRGFGTNFSGFIADLVRRAQESQHESNADRLADKIVSDAIPESSLTRKAGNADYRLKKKARGQTSAQRAPGSPKKAL